MAAKKSFKPDAVLGKFMGSTAATTWGAVLRKVWAHIKSQGLIKGRIVSPDAALAPILGKAPLGMMKVSGKILEHAKACP